MTTNKVLLDPMSEVEFHISHVDIDATSALNQHEAHIHHECEIYLNLSGDVFFEVEGRIYPVSRGSVILTRPYEIHHCVYRSNLSHRHYWITFSAGDSQKFLKMFFDRTKGSENLIQLDEEQLQSLCSVLEELLKSNTGQIRQRICFLQIFEILMMGKMPGHTDTVPGLSSYVQAALNYMEEHLTENIGIREMAAAAGVSVNTLERHFKDTFALSPTAMLRKKRLAESTRYLRDRATVSEAAMKSGFTDYSNFIQTFRRYYGMTPLTYQKKQYEQRNGTLREENPADEILS